jgi:hypothetical protein
MDQNIYATLLFNVFDREISNSNKRIKSRLFNEHILKESAQINYTALSNVLQEELFLLLDQILSNFDGEKYDLADLCGFEIMALVCKQINSPEIQKIRENDAISYSNMWRSYSDQER